MFVLNGRNAIVTGAGSGIGKAIAQRLAADGARVVVNDLNEAKARETVQEITDLDGVAVAVSGDVSSSGEVNRAFETCETTWGDCDLLVNNAGIVHQVRFAEMADDDWDKMISIHLRGTYLGCRRAIGPMLSNGKGTIINIASQLGQIGGVELVHYSAAKAGIIGLTKALAREVSESGVRVNTVAPGPVNTELVMRLSEAWRVSKAAELPLGRFGEPDEIAATVAFLASDESRTYVGQTLGPNSGDAML